MPIEREEFAATMGRLYDTTDEGFKGLNGRLDLLNGRTFNGEVARAKIEQRLSFLESIHHRRGNKEAGDSAALAIGLTKRESALLTLGFAIIAVLLKVIDFLGTKAWHAVVK